MQPRKCSRKPESTSLGGRSLMEAEQGTLDLRPAVRPWAGFLTHNGSVNGCAKGCVRIAEATCWSTCVPSVITSQEHLFFQSCHLGRSLATKGSDNDNSSKSSFMADDGGLAGRAPRFLIRMRVWGLLGAAE